MKLKTILFGFASLLIINACKKETSTPKSAFTNSVFIINQGNYGKANGDISYFNRDSLKITNNLFTTANGRPAGDVLQSMTHINSSYYIVANASNKIEIVDDVLFKQTGEITGLNNPRYILSISSTKAYVSEWGADGFTGAIEVIDLTSQTVTKRISVDKGAENMIKAGTSIYVACSGGYGSDSTVNVINPSTDVVSKKIPVNSNPSSFAIDANGKLWVLCGGLSTYDMATYTSTMVIQPSLIRINPENNTVESSTFMTGSTSIAANLCINNEKNKLFHIVKICRIVS